MLRILSVKAVVCLRLTLLLLIGLSRSVSADQPAALSVEEFKKQCIDTQIELLPQDFSKKVSDPSKFNSSKAIEAYEKFDKTDFDLNVCKVMAYNYFLEKKFERAGEQFKKVIDLVQDNNERFWAYYNWAMTFIAQGEEEEEKERRQVIGDGRSRASSQYVGALEKFYKALELNSNSPEIYYHLGALGVKFGGFHKSTENFKKAVQLNPLYEEAYSLWGSTLNILGKHKEAIEKFQRAAELNPQNSANYSNWGMALSGLGKYGEAIEKYQKSLEINPKNSLVYSNLGDALFNLGRFEEAHGICEKALEVNPYNADGYYILAKINLKIDKKEEALMNLEKAFEYSVFLKKQARDDKNLKGLWNNPKFKELTKLKL